MITLNGKSSLTINGGSITIGNIPISVLYGTILFTGNTSSYITIASDVDFQFGTGDFTVEWFQYQTDNSPYTRPWSQGSWPSSTISVSLEGGLFYYWEGGLLIDQGSIGSYKNAWVHFAVTRSGSTIKTFKDGTQIGSDISSSFNYTGTDDLCIGNQTDHLGSAAFGGNITNFRWIKGTCLYSSNFDIPTKPLTAVTGTKLLLLASTPSTVFDDSSGLSKTITSSNAFWAPYV